MNNISFFSNTENDCYEDNMLGKGVIQNVNQTSDMVACIAGCRSQEDCTRASFAQNGTCWYHNSRVVSNSSSEPRNGIVSVSMKCLGKLSSWCEVEFATEHYVMLGMILWDKEQYFCLYDFYNNEQLTKILATLSDGCKPGHKFNLVSEKCTICPLNTACSGMTITGDPCPARSFRVPHLTAKCVSFWWLSIPAGILLLIVLVIWVAKIWVNKIAVQPPQVHRWKRMKYSCRSKYVLYDVQEGKHIWHLLWYMS